MYICFVSRKWIKIMIFAVLDASCRLCRSMGLRSLRPWLTQLWLFFQESLRQCVKCPGWYSTMPRSRSGSPQVFFAAPSSIAWRSDCDINVLAVSLASSGNDDFGLTHFGFWHGNEEKCRQTEKYNITWAQAERSAAGVVFCPVRARSYSCDIFTHWLGASQGFVTDSAHRGMETLKTQDARGVACEQGRSTTENLKKPPRIERIEPQIAQVAASCRELAGVQVQKKRRWKVLVFEEDSKSLEMLRRSWYFQKMRVEGLWWVHLLQRIWQGSHPTYVYDPQDPENIKLQVFCVLVVMGRYSLKRLVSWLMSYVTTYVLLQPDMEHSEMHSIMFLM